MYSHSRMEKIVTAPTQNEQKTVASAKEDIYQTHLMALWMMSIVVGLNVTLGIVELYYTQLPLLFSLHFGMAAGFLPIAIFNAVRLALAANEV